MKGVPFSVGSMQKGYLFYQKWYIKGKGFGPRGGASPYNTLLSTPPPPGETGYLSKETLHVVNIHSIISNELSITGLHSPRTWELTGHNYE